MSNSELMAEVVAKANEWISGPYDEATKAEVKEMLEAEDKSALIDSFYKELEFGTGGLRGIMGAGSNRMNIYTVGAATQGLANYIKKSFTDLPKLKVAIGYDCRNNSRLFSETAAKIFAANGIEVLLFEDLRPTPELSYVIREYGCQSGIIITASHNPKKYNGYKAYWDDGAQMVAPHDTNTIDEVKKVKVEDIKFDGSDDLITIIGDDVDKKFIEESFKVSLSQDEIAKHKDLKIVYTPIHGTGVKLVPMAFERYGFTNVISVPEQEVVSGEFPTVISPNPEEPAALEMAIAKAKEVDAELVIATDPDADRLGICIKDDKGEFILVNGNQTALLFVYYLIAKRKEAGLMEGNEFVVKTIVTTELIAKIAEKNAVECFDCYTGFKYIAKVIRENEGVKQYIGGGEESYGFMPSDFVRDKDAVTSCALIAEIAAWGKENGKSLFEMLQDIYVEYGFSKERMKYVVKEGKEGADAIAAMMVGFKSNPPASLGGDKLAIVKDYTTLKQKNLLTGEVVDIDKDETTNALQFFTEGGAKVSVRPSGTEPKIKFYIEVTADLCCRGKYYDVDSALDLKVDAIMADLTK